MFKWSIRKTLNNRSYTRQNLVLVLNRVGSSAIIFFGFLIAMVIAIPGFTPSQLMSALGLGSVAIGFAFKDIFQNLLSGVLILLGEPFKIGDDIIVNNMEGTVEDIQIRATFSALSRWASYRDSKCDSVYQCGNGQYSLHPSSLRVCGGYWL